MYRVARGGANCLYLYEGRSEGKKQRTENKTTDTKREISKKQKQKTNKQTKKFQRTHTAYVYSFSLTLSKKMSRRRCGGYWQLRLSRTRCLRLWTEEGVLGGSVGLAVVAVVEGKWEVGFQGRFTLCNNNNNKMKEILPQTRHTIHFYGDKHDLFFFLYSF